MWHPTIWKPCGDRHRHRAPSHWVFTAIFLMFPTLRTSSSLWNYHTIVSVYHFVNYANVSHSKEPLGLAFVQPSALWVPRLVFRAHSFSLLSSVLCNGYSLDSPFNGSWADSSFHLWMTVLQISLSVGHYHVITTTRFSETNSHTATVGPQHNWMLRL